MEEKDLIKKLEEISLPEIEISSHKAGLKTLLVKKYFREKREKEIFGVFQKMLSAGVVVVLIILISASLAFPKYSTAKAKDIALRDPQIKEWIKKGAVVGDVKIIKNRAYVLVQPVDKNGITSIQAENKKGKGEEFYGALAEINLDEKKIAKIETLTPPTSLLTEKEREKVEEIAKSNPEIQKIVPKEAAVQSIKTPLPSLTLIKRGDSVEAVPEPEKEKRASIIYQFGKNQWEGKINLDEEKVEEVKFLGEVNDNATFDK